MNIVIRRKLEDMVFDTASLWICVKNRGHKLSASFDKHTDWTIDLSIKGLIVQLLTPVSLTASAVDERVIINCQKISNRFHVMSRSAKVADASWLHMKQNIGDFVVLINHATNGTDIYLTIAPSFSSFGNHSV